MLDQNLAKRTAAILALAERLHQLDETMIMIFGLTWQADIQREAPEDFWAVNVRCAMEQLEHALSKLEPQQNKQTELGV